MNKKLRETVYAKYDGHCAYCGTKIEYKDMQVDHIQSKYQGGTDDINNLNPACRRCNHYKRTAGLEPFRGMLKTLHTRTQKIYICKVAEDYGILTVQPWDGIFYFEKLNKDREGRAVNG